MTPPVTPPPGMTCLGVAHRAFPMESTGWGDAVALKMRMRGEEVTSPFQTGNEDREQGSLG